MPQQQRAPVQLQNLDMWPTLAQQQGAALQQQGMAQQQPEWRLLAGPEGVPGALMLLSQPLRWALDGAGGVAVPGAVPRLPPTTMALNGVPSLLLPAAGWEGLQQQQQLAVQLLRQQAPGLGQQANALLASLMQWQAQPQQLAAAVTALAQGSQAQPAVPQLVLAQLSALQQQVQGLPVPPAGSAAPAAGAADPSPSVLGPTDGQEGGGAPAGPADEALVAALRQLVPAIAAAAPTLAGAADGDGAALGALHGVPADEPAQQPEQEEGEEGELEGELAEQAAEPARQPRAEEEELEQQQQQPTAAAGAEQEHPLAAEEQRQEEQQQQEGREEQQGVQARHQAREGREEGPEEGELPLTAGQPAEQEEEVPECPPGAEQPLSNVPCPEPGAAERPQESVEEGGADGAAQLSGLAPPAVERGGGPPQVGSVEEGRPPLTQQQEEEEGPIDLAALLLEGPQAPRPSSAGPQAVLLCDDGHAPPRQQQSQQHAHGALFDGTAGGSSGTAGHDDAAAPWGVLFPADTTPGSPVAGGSQGGQLDLVGLASSLGHHAATPLAPHELLLGGGEGALGSGAGPGRGQHTSDHFLPSD